MSEATETPKAAASSTHIRAVGRRKEAAARVQIVAGQKEIIINGKPFEQYFSYILHQALIREPLKLVGLQDAFGVNVKVVGGGLTGQAEAVRHGIARALVRLNPEFRKTLKAVGFLRRDPRAKERKKFGLKRARKSAQWSKR